MNKEAKSKTCGNTGCAFHHDPGQKTCWNVSCAFYDPREATACTKHSRYAVDLCLAFRPRTDTEPRDDDPVDVLCQKILVAAEEEKAARERRVKAEQLLVKALPKDAVKIDKTVTTKVAGYSIQVKAPLYYKLDWEAYQAMNLEPDQQFVRMKPEIDKRRMRTVNPEIVASCVTSTPGKINVKIKPIEEGE